MHEDYLSANELEIILTTSPIQSHPCTQIIDASIDSMNRFPSLKYIHIYIVCDGARVLDQDKYKTGIVREKTFKNYKEYIRRLKQKYTDCKKYSFIQRQNRHGFAENIKYVMQQYCKTDLVMIYQHDHVIDGQIDFYSVVKAMLNFPGKINYITFMNKSYQTLIPRMLVNKEMKKFLLKLAAKDEKFNPIANIEELTEGIYKYYESLYGLKLLPLNFWYDKVHIASKQYYLRVIFNSQGNFDPKINKFRKTISFVQDSFGHSMKWSIEEKPQSISDYGAFVLWNKQPVFYHNNGRSFMTQQGKSVLISKGQEDKRKKKQEFQQNQQECFQGFDHNEAEFN